MERSIEKVWVPLEEREPNEVDRLRGRIKNIQEACEHEFRAIEEPQLGESLVSGVYTGSVEGFRVGEGVSFSATEMTLVCLHCGKQEEATIWETCPRCLSPMVEGHFWGQEAARGILGVSTNTFRFGSITAQIVGSVSLLTTGTGNRV